MIRAARLVLALLVHALPLATELPAQIQGKWARWEYFGMPCRDEVGTMWFATVSESSSRGVSLGIMWAAQAQPSLKAWVYVIGASRFFPGLLLPQGPFLPECRLYVAPDVVLPGASHEWHSPPAIGITWPRDTALLNTTFYFQGMKVHLLPFQPRFLINTSDGAKITITAI